MSQYDKYTIKDKIYIILWRGKNETETLFFTRY